MDFREAYEAAMDTSPIDAASIVAEAREWIGTPYAHHRRAKGVGVDCFGLVVAIRRDLIGGQWDHTKYPRTMTRQAAARALARLNLITHPWPLLLNALKRGEAMPGLVLGFSAPGARVMHLGISAHDHHGRATVIQADGNHGVIEHRLTGAFLEDLSTARTYREAAADE